MYPYKEEILSSVRAFVLAWTMILVPIVGFTTVGEIINNVYKTTDSTVN